MRIGLGVGEAWGGAGLDGMVSEIRSAATRGFASAWTAQLFNVDALTALAVAGHEVPDIALGTAVVPTYPRHPLVLASQALTAQAATGNRLTLGIGLSHRMVIEGFFGYSFDKPARHMREYLSALAPLLRGESVSFEGETIKAVGAVRVPGAEPPPLLVAALGPVMLRMAGELADGTVTWMTGPRTVADHIVPTISAAAAAAGRPAPRIVVGMAVCVTADEAAARAAAAKTLSVYGQLPSYRAMLDREGAAGPEDVVIVGDEAEVERQVRQVAAAGATELLVAPVGSREDRARTIDVMAGLATGGSVA
jgi:F420-dependent oxidoreductase-like protein